MLVDGRGEILELAHLCEIEQMTEVNGWNIDIWRMTAEGRVASVSAYNAVLEGGASDEIIGLLSEAGIELSSLLNDSDHSRDEITRSDVCEYIAAASLIASPACDIEQMHMPNIPKMSRRKSESGLDVVEIRLDDSSDGELNDGERLVIASVKHTVDNNSSANLRWSLAESISSTSLTPSYLASQFRVLRARLIAEGRNESSADRIYLFLRDFPLAEKVELYAIALAHPELNDGVVDQIRLLPNADDSNVTFRIILVPELSDIQSECN